MLISFFDAKSQSYIAVISVRINNSRNNYDMLQFLDFNYIEMINFKNKKWTPTNTSDNLGSIR